ncbi:MAG: aminotransferase class V-fold PLP-dependent enzyme [Myxococcales bacterium]|nr:aminotransferase class V-fold PLP-dependent enzyme [Myxococcales bacterium]
MTALTPRTHYASLADCVYLNQASLGLLGQPAVEAMHRFVDDVARHGNWNMSDADEVRFFEELRERAARLFGATGDRIAILSSASELLGQIPLLIPPIGGRKILAVATDFPAVTRPWLRLAASGDCQVQFVEDDPASDLTDDLIAALDRQTALIAVSCVQYATGTQLDVPRLQSAANQAGARLVVDATQAAGALAIDAAAWDADVVVSSGYKWLGGHGGVALAVMAPSLLERMPPLPGWMGAPDPFDFDATQVLLADDARRYTQSTMSYVSIAALTASLDQLLSLGAAQIETHARRLSATLIERVSKNGWQPFRDPSDRAASPHIVSLMRPGQELESTLEALRTAKIVCSSRGGRVRVSLAPYNDEGDIDSLVAALG